MRNSIFVKAQLWDAAIGDFRFRNIPHAYLKGASGVVFVYDVTKPESFDCL